MESGGQSVKPRRKYRIIGLVLLLGLMGARLGVLITRDMNCPEGFTQVPTTDHYLRCETDTNDLPALTKRLGLDGISECQIVCPPHAKYHVQYNLYNGMHDFDSVEDIKQWLSGDAYAMRFSACCSLYHQDDSQ